MDSVVERRPDGTWRVTGEDGTAPRVAHVVTDAQGTVWVQLEGEVLRFAQADPTRTTRRTAGAADLEAPMPAQVTAVLVEPGADVVQGDPLVLLDAMKMELPLRAPFDARVVAVHCAAGDRVAPGRALVDLVPREVSR